jgi:hypothetical protein
MNVVLISMKTNYSDDATELCTATNDCQLKTGI